MDKNLDEDKEIGKSPKFWKTLCHEEMSWFFFLSGITQRLPSQRWTLPTHIIVRTATRGSTRVIYSTNMLRTNTTNPSVICAAKLTPTCSTWKTICAYTQEKCLSSKPFRLQDIFSLKWSIYQCFSSHFLMEKHMSHFAYACKMRYPLNLVLESWEYLWFYWTFCIVILDYGLKLHKLSNHTLVMLQKWLEIH